MIKLTDEEMLTVLYALGVRYTELSPIVISRSIAKAQLKKVVEYLSDKAEYIRQSDGAVVLEIPKEEWQALLEEVEDAVK